MKQLGAGSGTEGVQAGAESALELVGAHRIQAVASASIVVVSTSP